MVFKATKRKFSTGCEILLNQVLQKLNTVLVVAIVTARAFQTMKRSLSC